MPRPDMRWLAKLVAVIAEAVIAEADTQAVAVDRYIIATLAAGTAGALAAAMTMATVDAPATAFPLSAL
jgi:hypothetical protein